MQIRKTQNLQLEPLGHIVYFECSILYLIVALSAPCIEGYVDKSPMFELLNSHSYMPEKIFVLLTHKLRL